MHDPRALDVKAFVPAKDLALSIRFYEELGFSTDFVGDDIAQLRIGGYRILLQPFFVEEHAHNFMMSLDVEDLDAWWAHVQEIRLAERYPGILTRAPAMQSWGLRVMFLSDPTGVLWHVVEREPAGEDASDGATPGTRDAP